jgi:DNA-binding Lrp family transcriptional regulator
MKLKLSANEKRVLELLIEGGRCPCTEIGRRVGISSQAVGRIQEKLESLGIIRGYATIVDYETLGIEVLGIAFFRFKSGSWTRLEEQDIRERVKGPHLITVYRVVEGDATHMVVYGFRSLKELDNYFHVLQTERGHISELKKLYILSASSILKDSPNELLIKAIEELGVERLARPENPKPMPEGAQI